MRVFVTHDLQSRMHIETILLGSASELALPEDQRLIQCVTELSLIAENNNASFSN